MRALSAQAEIAAFVHKPAWDGYAQTLAAIRYEDFGKANAIPTQYALLGAPKCIRKADPLFVTTEMLMLIREAADTFDFSETVGPEDILYPCGFVYWAEPHFSVDVNGGAIAHRALQWEVVRGHSGIIDDDDKVTPDEEEIDAVTFLMWGHANDLDDFQIPAKYAERLMQTFGS